VVRRLGISAAALACLLGGCNLVDDDLTVDPPPKPSHAAVERLKASPGAKYWLGASFGGRDLTYAHHGGPHTYLAYGEPECDASGCLYGLEVSTSAARDIVDPPRCWRSLGRALLLACGAHPQSARVLTGSVLVNVNFDGEPALPVIRSLRLMNDRSQPGSLPGPEPFTCRELVRIPDRFESHLDKRLLTKCSDAEQRALRKRLRGD